MDDIEKLTKAFTDHSAAVKTALEAAATNDHEQKSRLTEIEQRLVRGIGGGGGDERPQSWGMQVARSETVKALSSNWKGTARIEVKATITSLTTDAAGSAGDLARAHRPDGVIEMPRRKLPLRALFAPGKTDAGSVEWPKQTGRTANAAPQVEGATKGQSDMKFDLITWPVRTIAHFMLASKQILDDVPGLQSLIDSDLRYGLQVVEEDQLLNGGGTGSDLTGVYPGATAFSPPFLGQPILTEIDVLLQAIAQVETGDFECDGIVLNPLDWRLIQGLKDDEGNYLGAGPFGAEQMARLWSMPVATTTTMIQRSFMVGACRQGAQIFDRQEATVEISTEDSDNFRKNLVTLRGEERLAFVIKHQGAFVKGNFDTALGM